MSAVFKRGRAEVHANLTSLIDVTFLLIVFFVLVSQIVDAENDCQLPLAFYMFTRQFQAQLCIAGENCYEGPPSPEHCAQDAEQTAGETDAGDENGGIDDYLGAVQDRHRIVKPEELRKQIGETSCQLENKRAECLTLERKVTAGQAALDTANAEYKKLQEGTVSWIEDQLKTKRKED